MEAQDNPRFTVELEQGTLVRVCWEPRIVMVGSDGALLTAEIDRSLPGRRVHLLMLLNGMTALSQTALAYFADRAPLSAVGLVGPSVLDQPLIELYLEVYRPPFPMSYFDHEHETRAWLGNQPSLPLKPCT